MAAERSAVLLDWGGVMTSNLFGSFRAFCAEEGLDPDVLANLFRHDRDARALLIDFECGRIEEADFEPRLADRARPRPGTRASSTASSPAPALDEAMVDGVRALHERGVATGLVSNSWGTRRYPRDLLAELFDGIVISGEEGFRKPDPRMYELGAQRIGAEPDRVRVRRRPGLQPRPCARARDGRGASHVGGFDAGGAGAAGGLGADSALRRCAALKASPRERVAAERPVGRPAYAWSIVSSAQHYRRR